MGVVVALLLSAAFGAADQYLGSLSAHPWGADVSLLSAPWLVLPFVVGATTPQPRRAALLGFAATYAALLGYFLMTDSPIENAHYSLAGARGFLISERAVVIGGLVSGPLFGWLGHQWRTRRAPLGALAVAGALCLEPLARRASVNPIRFRDVWLAEVSAGVLVALYVALNRSRHALHLELESPHPSSISVATRSPPGRPGSRPRRAARAPQRQQER